MGVDADDPSKPFLWGVNQEESDFIEILGDSAHSPDDFHGTGAVDSAEAQRRFREVRTTEGTVQPSTGAVCTTHGGSGFTI